MKGSQNLSDFFRSYDLYDRFVDGITVDDARVTFSLGLFHCDDPARNDERKNYKLTLVFAKSAVTFAEDPIPDADLILGGEILQYDQTDTAVIAGIEWKLRAGQAINWTRVHIAAPPLSAKEVITDVER